MTNLKVTKITTNKSNGYEMKNRLRFRCTMNYNAAHHLQLLIEIRILIYSQIYIILTSSELNTNMQFKQYILTRSQQVKYTCITLAKYIPMLKHIVIQKCAEI